MEPIKIGITRLSKSFNGRTSISIANVPKINDIRQLWQNKQAEINTAKKQVKLPATVFPFVPGITTLPISFPIKLARPSPNDKAYIPIVAQSKGNINDASKIPDTRVTGPKTNLFSSRFLAAVSVIFEIIGIVFPLRRKISL